MGIIITVALLLSVLLLVSKTLGIGKMPASKYVSDRSIGLLALSAGLWNVLWYGLRHYEQFWGVMALCSGLALIAAGTVILTHFKSILMQALLSFLLLVFFVLYAITLIQLNLGMPILG